MMKWLTLQLDLVLGKFLKLKPFNLILILILTSHFTLFTKFHFYAIYSRFSTEQEIDYIVEYIKSAVGRLREMSPLWEMKQEGIDLGSVQWTQPH